MCSWIGRYNREMQEGTRKWEGVWRKRGESGYRGVCKRGGVWPGFRTAAGVFICLVAPRGGRERGALRSKAGSFGSCRGVSATIVLSGGGNGAWQNKKPLVMKFRVYFDASPRVCCCTPAACSAVVALPTASPVGTSPISFLYCVFYGCDPFPPPLRIVVHRRSVGGFTFISR